MNYLRLVVLTVAIGVLGLAVTPAYADAPDPVPSATHGTLVTNPDGSRTFGAVNMHGTRLYLLEATVPRGAPAPGLFQQSLMFLDDEGRVIRYRSYYSPNHSDEWKFPAPPPPRAR